MKTEGTPARPEGTAERLDQEMTMVQGAIQMVAGRGTSSVTVGGMRFGEEVLHALEDEASRSGVRLVPLWRLDCHGCDVRAVRRA